eukprot:2795648-Rhodomonas_salina.1
MILTCWYTHVSVLSDELVPWYTCTGFTAELGTSVVSGYWHSSLVTEHEALQFQNLVPRYWVLGTQYPVYPVPCTRVPGYWLESKTARKIDLRLAAQLSASGARD